VVEVDAAGGAIEAVTRSPWFGVRHELVVRVSPGRGAATLVDARSRSRDSWNGHDLGANAAYLRAFVAALRNTVPEPGAVP
jgi:hypothetical protein